MSLRIESAHPPLMPPSQETESCSSLQRTLLRCLQTEQLTADHPFSIETFALLPSLPHLTSLVLSHLTFSEMRRLFVGDLSTASLEELAAILHRSPSAGLRTGLMCLFFSRLDPAIAIKLVQQFEWSFTERVEFINTMRSHHNILRYGMEELTVILGRDQFASLQFTLLNPALAKLSPSIAVALFTQFDWEENKVIAFIQYIMLNANTQAEIALADMRPLFDKIHSPEKQVDSLIFLGSYERFRDFADVCMDLFRTFDVNEEAQRVCFAAFLAIKFPTVLFSHYSSLEIHQDHHRAIILKNLLRSHHSLLLEEVELLQFSSKENEWEILRREAQESPFVACKVLAFTDHLPLIEACIHAIARGFGFDAAAIETRCLKPLAKIQAPRDRIRALRWLGAIMEESYDDSNHASSILHHDQISKIFSSMMLFRNPSLRSDLTEAYLDLFTDTADWARYLGQVTTATTANFHRKLYQPILSILRESFLLRRDQQTILKEIRGQGPQITWIPYLYSLRPDESKAVRHAFQGYHAYCKLLSPDKFDHLVAAPIIRALKKWEADSKIKRPWMGECKRRLYATIEKPKKFEAWLSSKDLPATLQSEIAHIVHNYQDAPPKHDFQFIQLYCVLLQSDFFMKDKLPLGAVDDFLKKVFPVFDLHYHDLIELLHLMNYSDLVAIQKVYILMQLLKLFSGANRTPSATHYISKELHSLIAIIHYINANDLGSSKIKELFSQGNYSTSASSIAAELLDLNGDAVAVEKFNRLFNAGKLEGLFPSYLAKLTGLEDEKHQSVIDSVKGIVSSVLRETYHEDRMAIENSPQLQAAAAIDPDAVERWKNLHYSYTFTLPDDPAVYTIETSTHFADTLLLGTGVYGSCQNLVGNPYNTKCIPGFFDPKFLPLLIKKEGKTVSRSLLILETTEEASGIKSLALYLELFYTKNLNPHFIGKIEELALKIRKDMGYPVIKGSKTKFPEGFYDPHGLPKYSPGPPYLGKVISHVNGWGPYEFSDAFAIQIGEANSGITNGEFILEGHMEYLMPPPAEPSCSSSSST